MREKIVEAIPLGVRYGIAPAIGLMLMNVGLGSNVGIYSENGGPFYMMRDFFGALTPSIIKGNMGAGYDAMVLTLSLIHIFVSYRLLTDGALRGGAMQLIGFVLLWALLFAFVWFTYRPLHLPLFLDPVSGCYGLETPC